jgi:hypothetical protein
LSDQEVYRVNAHGGYTDPPSHARAHVDDGGGDGGDALERSHLTYWCCRLDGVCLPDRLCNLLQKRFMLKVEQEGGRRGG